MNRVIDECNCINSKKLKVLRLEKCRSDLLHRIRWSVTIEEDKLAWEELRYVEDNLRKAKTHLANHHARLGKAPEWTERRNLKMSKHTPGPWNKEKIRYILRHVSKQDIFYGYDDDFEEKTPNIPDYYNNGDANLIAAAPEMFEALKAVFEISNDSNSNPHELLSKISRISEVAIKKTEVE